MIRFGTQKDEDDQKGESKQKKKNLLKSRDLINLYCFVSPCKMQFSYLSVQLCFFSFFFFNFQSVTYKSFLTNQHYWFCTVTFEHKYCKVLSVQGHHQPHTFKTLKLLLAKVMMNNSFFQRFLSFFFHPILFLVFL